MSENTAGKRKEFKEIKKSFKNYDLVIDKTKIATAIVVLIVIVIFNVFMLYLADVFE